MNPKQKIKLKEGMSKVSKDLKEPWLKKREEYKHHKPIPQSCEP